MTNNDKYINELETQLQAFQKKEKEWEKEQSASIKLFKDKEKEISKLNNSLNSLTQEREKDQQKLKDLSTENKNQAQQIKVFQKEKKDLLSDNQKLYQAVQDSLKSMEIKEKSLREVREKLLASEGKREILEEELKATEGDKSPSLNHGETTTEQDIHNSKFNPYIGKVKSLQKQIQELEDKLESAEINEEAILEKAEQARNEQAEEIERLERELEKAKTGNIDNLLLEQLQAQNQEYKQIISKLETKNQEQYEVSVKQEKTIQELEKQVKSKGEVKLFTCSQCQQEWSVEFLRLVDKKGDKTCSECLESMLELTKQETNKEVRIEYQEPQQEIKPEPLINCQFCSKPYPQSQLKPRHIKNLPNHDSKEITLICQTCLTYRAIKDPNIVYCPRLGNARDTYEGNEYDCYC